MTTTIVDTGARFPLAALAEIRHALADMCPAWALEWPTVRTVMDADAAHPDGPDRDPYTAQDVRDEVRPALDRIFAAIDKVVRP